MKDTGTYEEWWAGPKKDKRLFSSKEFTQTEYVTDTGTYTSGNLAFLPLAESLLRQRLLSPLPTAHEYDSAILLRRKQDFGTIQLDCVILARKMANLATARSALFPNYCFNRDAPILRWSGSFGQRNTLYNQIINFRGKYLARDLTVTEDNNVMVLKVHIDSIENLSPDGYAGFVPPRDAITAPVNKTVLGEEVMQGRILKNVQPQYPEEAKQKHIEGKVTIQAEIGEDGHIHEMTIESAPDPLLAASALLAVKQWRYEPYLLNGKPVRVETQVVVTYNLGR